MATVGSAIVCDRLRLYGNRSLCDRLRSAIVCDRLRSYGNQPLLDFVITVDADMAFQVIMSIYTCMILTLIGTSHNSG